MTDGGGATSRPASAPEEARPGAEGERVSRWFAIDQARIDAFAAVCEDHQFIHVDPARAAETRFGGTIAHGFLTLSLLSAMAYDAIPATDALSVNYGFDRVRFVSPVPSGARVRGRFTVAQTEERAPGERTLHWDVAVEVEGAPRPALVARWLSRRYASAA